MAITNGDGSIILTTKVDQTGLHTGINTMKSATTKVGTAFKKLGGYIATALSVTAFIRFSREAGQMATQQEANVKRLIDIYGEASQAVSDYIDANARALGMSKSSASSFSAVYGNLFSVWADQKTNAELTTHYLNMTAVVASKSGRTVEDVQERVRSGLLGNTEAIEDLGIFVNVKTIEMTDAFKRLADGRSWEQLGAYEQQQVRTMAILEQATQKYGNTVADTTALTRARYKAAYEDMQATWGQFVNVVLMPVLKVATQIMDIITAGMRAIAGLTGKTIENATAQSNAIGGAADNQKALTDETKKTAKEQKKLLAGFDEINILSQGGGSDSSTASDTSTGNIPIVTPTESSSGNGMAEGINSTLATIMGIIGGALVALGVLLLFYGGKNPMLIGWGIGFIIAGAAMLGVSIAAIGDSDIDFSTKFSSIVAIAAAFILALGLVLLMKVPGAQPLALGMIIAGAGILAVSAARIAANKIGGEVGDMLHGIIAIVSGFLLAIGLIMLFSGKISPLSIGLVITGAVGLASEIALNPDAVKKSLQGWVGGILAIISGALLVIGIILCCCGIVTPLSIGMIVVGAVGLAAVVALNWNTIKEKVSTFFKDNAGLIAGISLALLVLGIILCLTGVGIPLAIGLIAAGAVGLVSVVALNWDTIKEKVKSAFNKVIDWVKTYGLLVLGIILCLTGVGIPLGIALIIKWAKEGAEKGVPLAAAIVDKVKEIWKSIKGFWDKNIAPIFTTKWWADLGKKCINGLISGFESGINGIIGAFEDMINWIVDGLNTISFDIPDWLGGGSFGINLPRADFGEVKIPRLARGAVIPPNREFLAVLGDQKQGVNIEAPLQTIVDAFNISLAQNGGYNSGNTEVVLEIDGREFGRAVVEQGNKENRRIGTRLVIV